MCRKNIFLITRGDEKTINNSRLSERFKRREKNRERFQQLQHVRLCTFERECRQLFLLNDIKLYDRIE